MQGILPRCPAVAGLGQLGVHPVPGRDVHGAVPGGLRAPGGRRPGPGRAVPALDRVAVLPGPAAQPGRLGRRRPVHDPGAPQPGAQHQRQVRQQPGQPDHVVPGIEHHDDARVARAPVPGPLQPPGHLAQLRGGHLGGVVVRAEPDRVQRRGPRRRARAQRGHERVRPARDPLPGMTAPAVHVAEHPLRAGPGLGPQPVAHIGRQPDPPVRPARQRQHPDRPPQPRHAGPPRVQRVIHRAVPPPVPGHQRQRRQDPHRPVRAQHRINQVEQLISPPG
jgi:hypothetical protein